MYIIKYVLSLWHNRLKVKLTLLIMSWNSHNGTLFKCWPLDRICKHKPHETVTNLFCRCPVAKNVLMSGFAQTGDLGDYMF